MTEDEQLFAQLEPEKEVQTVPAPELEIPAADTRGRSPTRTPLGDAGQHIDTV